MQNNEPNPYINARREWVERYGDYITQARNWQIAATAGIITAIILSVGLVVSITQNKITPYIVEVDKLGQVAAIEPAGEFKKLDAKVIKSSLAHFIENSRSVIADPIVQKKSLENIYAFLPKSSAPLAYLQEYINNNNPFKLAESKTIEVEISTILSISEQSWQVEWFETSRDLQGNINGKTKWKSVLTVEFNPPTTEKAILSNPLGLFITQLSWVQQL
jgi:type IV secretion system protein VirB5